MKKCKDLENDLPLYLDDLLPAAEKRSVEEHLKSCLRCQKALIQLNKTRLLVSHLREVKPPQWFRQRIMSRVREEAQKQSAARKWFYPLPIKIPVQIMATVFIAVLAVYIYNAGEDQMKKVITSSRPAPVMEVQKNQIPEQKIKPSANEAVQRKEQTMRTRGGQQENIPVAAVDAAKDLNKQVVPDIKGDRYASAPAAKPILLPEAAGEKKKEKQLAAESMTPGGAIQAKWAIQKINVLIRVADIDVAGTEVEKLLMKYEAKNISKQTTKGETTLTAKLKNQRVKDLITELKRIGQVTESSVFANDADVNILLAIEIVNN